MGNPMDAAAGDDSVPPGTPGAPAVGENGATATTIWLQWTKPTSGGIVEKYDLEIVNRPLTKTVQCKTNMVEVHDLKHSQIYQFRVRAVNKAGVSGWSESTQQTTAYQHEKGNEFCTMKTNKHNKNKEVKAAEKKGVCNACLVQ